MIKTMIDRQINWDILMSNVNNKKSYYEFHIEKFETLFEDIKDSEKYKISQINNIEEKYNLNQ